ncbi:hypothetical protein [Clostridium sp. LP20]|uniref:hypothetical protein n=1 Tax=Clostridium sp. LP20 TaxID=3418665 RepID=UPI003EE666BC
MEFVTDNGIRFTQNKEGYSIEDFIAKGPSSTTVILPNDIFVEFEGEKYIDSYELPF